MPGPDPLANDLAQQLGREYEAANPPPPVAPLALKTIDVGIDALADSAGAVGDNLTLHERFAFLSRLRATRARLADIEAAIEAELVRDAKTVGMWAGELDGERFKLVGGKDRKSWDHRGAGKDYLNARFTPSPMRVPPTPSPLDVLDAILEAAGMSYWRVGVLRAHGLDPDEYCEKVPGRTAVVFEPWNPAG